MAYSKDDFLRDLAIYSTGAAIGPKNTAKFFLYAGKKGIQLAGIGASRAAVPAARGIGAIVRRNPYAFAGLTLYEAERRGLLDEPIARGREAFEEGAAEIIDRTYPYMPQEGPPPGWQGFGMPDVPKKKKVSKYNRAVAAGMKAAKASTSYGKKGTLNNTKKAFAAVNRTASKVNKGKKVSTKGAIGKIARAVKRILK